MPDPMTEAQVADFLEAAISIAAEGADRDALPVDLRGTERVANPIGLVMSMADGTEFEIVVKRTK